MIIIDLLYSTLRFKVPEREVIYLMNEYNETRSAALLPVRGTLLLPDTTIQLRNIRQDDLDRIQNGEFVAALVKADHEKEQWNAADFYPYGLCCALNSIEYTKNGTNIYVNTKERVKIEHVVEGRFATCAYTAFPDENDLPEKSGHDMLLYMKNIVSDMAHSFRGGDVIVSQADTMKTINELISYLAQYMPLSQSERYELLEQNPKQRALLFIDLLLRQKEVIAINLEMNEKFSEQANKYYREQALRRQMEAIKKELNETDGEEAEDSYRQKVMAAGLPVEIEKALLEDVKKLESANPQGGNEQELLKNYLDFALSLPWKKEELTFADLKQARTILDSRHYGMDKVKERIIQHLAIMRLKNSNKGSAILLVGPPGTGKTSLGRSIAQSLGREYVRMSLGGVRDESEIRGHRRTYVGAMAGRVLQAMKQAKTTNPVIILDELDKLMQGGFSGDPAAAMLEVLDPEQNNTFTDHYLNLPYDLSDVLFIATANSLDTISGPLLDRMEVIEVSGYTGEEKFHIAKDHLLPEVLDEYGITPDQLQIKDETLRNVIENYTMEAGCRGLKKRIEAIARARSEAILESDGAIIVDNEAVEEILGPKRARHETIKEFNPAGVVTGLAWTAAGGEILFIETTDMPGTGQTIITGQLGEVMQESARIAQSVLRSRLPMQSAVLKERDLHIHVPAGATPKDGPSAGITLFTALASLVLDKPVDPHIAMTGELSLSGQVLPIGGLKEKLYGARRAGITKVLIPWDNRADLHEVPQEIKDKLDIVPVHTIEEVLKEALDLTLPPFEHTFASPVSMPMQ